MFQEKTDIRIITVFIYNEWSDGDVVDFFYRSYQVVLTDVVIIPRWAKQAPGGL
jgi:hypothetical protein